MVYDSDVSYFHYLVVNAPGCDAAQGTEAFDYLFSFAVDRQPDKSVNTNPGDDFFHRHVHQCFEQRTELDINDVPSAKGCEGLFSSRGTTLETLITDLKLRKRSTCANILKVPYTAASNNGVCQLARCSDFGPPMTLPGITDQPECAEGATGPFPSLNINIAG